jgi:nitrate reductase gamma subunit
MILESIGIIEVLRAVSLLAFILGFAYRLIYYFRRNSTKLLVKSLGKNIKLLKLKTIPNLIYTFLVDIFSQIWLRRRKPYRWICHFLIFIGGMGMILFHAVPRGILWTTEEQLFPGFATSTRIMVHDGLGVIIIPAAIYLLVKRLASKDLPRATTFYDVFPLVILILISVVGFFLYHLEYFTHTRGALYIAHIILVYGTLILIPHTKFLHWFIRLLSFPLNILSESGEVSKAQKICKRCGAAFTFQESWSNAVASASGIDQEFLEYCPNCRKYIRASQVTSWR